MGKRKTLAEINEYLKVHLPNVYLQSGQSYLNSKLPLKFECSHHGEFTTSWNQVHSGSHCPECGQERLKDKVSNRRTPLSSILKKVDEVHNGTIRILNQNKYEKQHSRLIFECHIGHQWETKVYHVIQGKGCPKCAGKNITTAEFIETLNNVHSGKLSLLPNQKYKSRSSKLSFKCNSPEHPVFKATPSNIIFRKSGCPKCKKETLKNHFAFTTNEVYRLIQEKCGDQIIPLPNQVYENQNTRWEFKCPESSHPNWIAKIGHVLNSEYKYGCRQCSGQTSYNSIDEINQDIVSTFDGNIQIIEFEDEMLRKTSSGIFYCKKHDDRFEKRLIDLLRSYGCKECTLDAARIGIEEFRARLFEVHRELVTIVDETTFIDMSTKIEVRCHKEKHGIFQTTPQSLVISQTGCPICRMSKGEKAILFWLRDNNIEFEYQYWVKKLSGNGHFIFDFFIPSRKLIIEFDGKQHFEPVEVWGGIDALKKNQQNDLLKDEYAAKHLLKMLRIPYHDYFNIDNILTEHLLLE